MSNIAVGSIVKLKSGGLQMTVSSIDGDEAFCHWFDTKMEPQVRRFPLVILTIA